MAPIKFEEKMQERLENRRLQPSEDSWDKLASRLDTAEKPSKNRFWIYGIAASIVILISVGFVFVNESPIVQPTPKMVNQTENIQNKQSIEETPIENSMEQLNLKDKDSNTEVAFDKPDKEINPSTKPQRTNVPKKSLGQDIAKMNLAQAETQAPTPDINEITETVALTATVEDNSTSVTDKELDALLNTARASIVQQEELEVKTADRANQLLQEIESDIEESFRSKMFEVLFNGYKSVRTAVADRNN